MLTPHAPCVVCFWVSGIDKKIKWKLCRILLLKFESELSFLVQQAPSRLELFSQFSYWSTQRLSTFRYRLFIFWSASSREDARSWAKGGNTLWGTMHYGKLVRDVCRHVRWVDNSDRSKLTLMQIYTPKKYSCSIEVCSHNHPHHHYTSKSV